jgi:hypothetical protein
MEYEIDDTRRKNYARWNFGLFFKEEQMLAIEEKVWNQCFNDVVGLIIPGDF